MKLLLYICNPNLYNMLENGMTIKCEKPKCGYITPNKEYKVFSVRTIPGRGNITFKLVTDFGFITSFVWDWDEKFEIVNLEEFRIKREQLKKNLERLNIK